MNTRNLNSLKMKENNIKLVLSVIQRKKEISRAQLSEDIGLTRASITNIVNDLISDGFLIESGMVDSKLGRRATLLKINPEAGYIIGAELVVGKISCIITDFSTKIILRKNCKVDTNQGPDTILAALINLLESLITESAIPREMIKGIGLVSAGPYDYQKGVMINPPNFKGWDNVDIKDIVEKKMGLPVYFEKETPAAALAEYWFGEGHSSKSLFMLSVLDIGIGGSLVLDGSIYHGYKGGAAEIGHATIDFDGPRCEGCGSYGCLEALADGLSTVERLKRNLKLDIPAMESLAIDDISEIDFDFLVDEAQRGQVNCLNEIKKSAMFIGVALQNVITMFSPDTIVLAGEFVEKSSYLVNEIIRYTKQSSYFRHLEEIRVYKSKLDKDIYVLGAVALVLEKYFKLAN